jgi:hypothetical protein
MRLYFLLVISTVTPLLVTPLSILEVLDKTSSVLKLLESAWEFVNNDLGIVEISDRKRERMIFSKIDNINMQLVDMNVKINGQDDDINMLLRKKTYIPEELEVQLELNDLRIKHLFIENYYQRMEKYVVDLEDYKNSTLIDFIDGVVSNYPNSAISLVEAVNRQVTESKFLRMLLTQFNLTNSDYPCKERRSAQQAFYNFFGEILLINTKSHVLIEVAYIIKHLYGQGNFTKRISDDNKQFRANMNNIITTTRPYMMQASLELWRCDPKEHIPGNSILGYKVSKCIITESRKSLKNRDEVELFSRLTTAHR